MARRRPSSKQRENNAPQQIGFEFTFPEKRPTSIWTVDELYDDMSEHVAVDAKEDSRIERKSAQYNKRELGDYFSMWANTPPYGGIILIGVENDGRISGCKGVDEGHISDLQRAGDVYCPEARYQDKRVPVRNMKGEDDYVIAVRVLYRDDKVVETSAGDAFQRRGSSKKKLTDTEKRELQLMKGQLEIESDPVQLQYPSDFNTALINQFVANVRNERKLPSTHSTEEVLTLRRLGSTSTGKFVPNLVDRI